MKIKTNVFAVVMALQSTLAGAQGLTSITSSAPQSVAITFYDTGIGQVSEVRRLLLSKDDNRVRVEGLPVRLDSSSVSLHGLARGGEVAILDQRFEYDGALPRLLARYLGQDIVVHADQGVLTGRLQRVQSEGADPALMLLQANGAACYLPEASQLESIVFPQAAQEDVFLKPTVLWTIRAAQEGPQSLRLNYVVEGMEWTAFYDGVLSEDEQEFSLSGKVRLVNRSGGAFTDAQVRLTTTEKGATPPPLPASGAPDRASAALRYAYGTTQPAFEKQVASYGGTQSLDLPGTVSLQPDETVYIQTASAPRVPASLFYVYDGVKFDRFQRNPKTDWNYGTETHPTVAMHLQFSNTIQSGLGQALPPGTFRLYREQKPGFLMLAGEDYLQAVPADGSGHILLGPAADLNGARERTGYREVVPLREYEESFEIRLENNSAREMDIRVVEHLYRGGEFEIIKADLEYTATAPQTIEFVAPVKAGGKRAIHYTVRYRW